MRFILLTLAGMVLAAVLQQGAPSAAGVQQYIAENIMLSDVKVTDGDTIRVKGQRYRLFGIDAPESKQTCNKADGSKWGCGSVARTALFEMVNGQDIRCDVTGNDKYGRGVAVCYAGNVELNREMVKQGMAVAYTQYSKRYLAEEQTAKAGKMGIWQGRFMEPREWRRKYK